MMNKSQLDFAFKDLKRGDQPNQTKMLQQPTASRKRPLQELQQIEKPDFRADFDYPELKEHFEKSQAQTRQVNIFSEPVKQPPQEQTVSELDKTQNVVFNKDSINFGQMSKSTTLSTTFQSTTPQNPNETFFKVDRTWTIEDYDTCMRKKTEKNRQDEEIRSVLNLFASERIIETNLDKQLEMSNSGYHFHHAMLHQPENVVDEFFQVQLGVEQDILFLSDDLIGLIRNSELKHSLTVRYLKKREESFLKNKQVLDDSYITKETDHTIVTCLLNEEILYICTTSQILCYKLSRQPRLALTLEQEINDPVIVQSILAVDGKVWIGREKPEMLSVIHQKPGFFACRSDSTTKISLPRQSLVHSMISSISFFKSKQTVIKLYDLQNIGLAAATINKSKTEVVSLDEVYIYDRNSLILCCVLKIQWLYEQIELFLTKKYPRSQSKQFQIKESELIQIHSNFDELNQRKCIVIVFSSGERVYLQIAPQRSQQGVASKNVIQIQLDDLSVFLVESSPLQGSFFALDEIQQNRTTQRPISPLLSYNWEVKMPLPFQQDFVFSQIKVVKYVSCQHLEVFVAQRHLHEFFIVTLVRQQHGLRILSIELLACRSVFDLRIQANQKNFIIQILNEHGLVNIQQKNLRDHIGSYLLLKGLTKDQGSQLLQSDFDQLLAHYPKDEILSILADFFLVDSSGIQTFSHDVTSYRAYYIQSDNKQSVENVRITKDFQQSCFKLFKELADNICDQQQTPKWEIYKDAVLNVLKKNIADRFLFQFPFKVDKDGLRPETINFGIKTLEQTIEFLQTLRISETSLLINFCKKMCEVLQFLQIALTTLQFSFDKVLNQILSQEQIKDIRSIQIFDLVDDPMHNQNFLVFLEHYLAIILYNQDICLKVTQECCQKFLDKDFFDLACAKRIFHNSKSAIEEVRTATNVLCYAAEKTDLFSTFDLLIENSDIFSIMPALYYLKNFADTFYTRHCWCIKNERSLENLETVVRLRDEALNIMLELVEETIYSINQKVNELPMSKVNGVNNFRQKLGKISDKQKLNHLLQLLVRFVQGIDDQKLHLQLFELLLSGDQTEYIKSSSSQYLQEFFKDRIIKESQSTKDIKIVAENLINLKQYKQCMDFLLEKIGYNYYFKNVDRQTVYQMNLCDRLALLAQAEVCFEFLSNKASSLKIQEEMVRFRKVLQLQKDILMAIKTKSVNVSSSSLEIVQNDVLTPAYLEKFSIEHRLWLEYFQSLNLSVNQDGQPLVQSDFELIKSKVLQGLQMMIQELSEIQLISTISSLHQLFERQLVMQKSQIFGLKKAQSVNFFPTDHILQVCMIKDPSLAILELLVKVSSFESLIQQCIQLGQEEDFTAKLLVLLPLLQQMTKTYQQLTSPQLAQLNKLKDQITTRIIDNYQIFSTTEEEKARQTLICIDKLISF